MIDPEIRDQTYQFFIEEAPELLQILETGLLNLARDRSSALIHDLMRSAHSIKGGAATVGLEAIATIAHRLESILRVLHSDKIELDTDLETRLIQAYDCLKQPLQQQIELGSFAEDTALAEADSVFSGIECQLGDLLHEADSCLPDSTDMGVDMVSSIFEVDVAQGIERLSKVLNEPEEQEVAGELRAQAEVFAGFAEILNLPGFGAIAKAAIAALELHPEKDLEIMSLALGDFQAARELVLAGDRDRGGSPSKALTALTIEPAREIPLTIPPADSGFVLDAPTLLLSDVNQSCDELDCLLAEDSPEELTVPAEAVIETKPASRIETKTNATSSLSTERNQQSDRHNLIQPATKFTSTTNLKVKVDLHRLETMNDLVGEIVIDRNSLALRQEQLQTTIRKIQQGLKQFRHLTTVLQNQAVRDTLAIDSTGMQSSVPHITQDKLFDSLGMERYGNERTSIEATLEQMMQLEEAVEDLALFTRQSNRTIRQQQQTLTKLRDQLMWARMLPLEQILNHFPRALRDLSAQYQKPVNLELKGTEILVDKGILKKLYDPLLHLLRNAFDHGIEMSEVRLRQGKPETGNITIHAAHRGNRTVIEISDDGRGLDLTKIAQKAIARGWLSVEQLTQTNKEQLLNYIFEPGFSTAERVSKLSGRGVGLDVVRSQLQEVNGTVTVDSTPGKGTTFSLSLPLTLTIAKLLVCSVGTTNVALPVAGIKEIVPATKAEVQHLGEQKAISWREQLLPIYQLSDLLKYYYPSSDRGQTQLKTNGSAMLVIHAEKANFAVEVENFGTEQEMVIKPLTGIIVPPNYVYGCTVMGDGSLIPAIDAVALLSHVKENIARDTAATDTPVCHPSEIPTVLVVDDSAMMRRTLTLTLQKVGYRVLQAHDGEEAIEVLLQNSGIQLIVSDLEMPNLNGFEFLNRLRQEPSMASIPVVMLTTRSNHKHRQLALHLGAKAYLNKPYIEREFLDVLRTTISC